MQQRLISSAPRSWTRSNPLPSFHETVIIDDQDAGVDGVPEGSESRSGPRGCRHGCACLILPLFCFAPQTNDSLKKYFVSGLFVLFFLSLSRFVPNGAFYFALGVTAAPVTTKVGQSAVARRKQRRHRRRSSLSGAAFLLSPSLTAAVRRKRRMEAGVGAWGVAS